SVGSQQVEGGWVDAKGMFLAGAGAGPVYELLGKKGLGTSEFPPQETALTDGEVAFRQHAGGHTTGPNWPTFLKFADRYINGPPPLQPVGGVWDQQRQQPRRVALPRVEPGGELLRRQDRRHSVVQRPDQVVGGHRQDGHALDGAGGSVPPVPQGRQRQRAAADVGEVVRLLRLAAALPLVETAGGDEAPAEPERGAERRLSGG